MRQIVSLSYEADKMTLAAIASGHLERAIHFPNLDDFGRSAEQKSGNCRDNLSRKKYTGCEDRARVTSRSSAFWKQEVIRRQMSLAGS